MILYNNNNDKNKKNDNEKSVSFWIWVRGNFYPRLVFWFGDLDMHSMCVASLSVFESNQTCEYENNTQEGLCK